MLTVADNLARTHHLTYNQSMPATGIQPLATFIFAGLAEITNAFGGDAFTLIRAVLFFGILLFLVFAWQLAFLSASLAAPGSRRLVFLFAFFLVACDFTAFRLFTYGLETGIYLVAITACMQLWKRITSAPQAGWSTLLPFGLACGVAGLARIDFGIFVAILLGYLLCKRIATTLQALVVGLIALLVMAPWFAFVHRVTGGWLPSSSKAESSFFTLNDFERLHSAYLAFAAHVFPWSFAGANRLPTQLVTLISIPAVLGIALSVRWSLPELRRRLPPGFLQAWVPAFLVISCAYILFFWSSHFYPRYFAPLLVLVVPVLALLFATQKFMAKHAVEFCIAGMLSFILWDISSLHTGRVGSNLFLAAGYVHDNFPTARVGSFQSGTIGYFNRNAENLDGKLNQAAFQARAAGHLDGFIDHEKINVLVDWRTYIESLPSTYLAQRWHPCPIPMPQPDTVCLVRDHPL